MRVLLANIIGVCVVNNACSKLYTIPVYRSTVLYIVSVRLIFIRQTISKPHLSLYPDSVFSSTFNQWRARVCVRLCVMQEFMNFRQILASTHIHPFLFTN